MATSACVGEATTVVVEAELFAVLGSEVSVVTPGEFVITVPGVVVVATCTTRGKLAVAPEASEPIVQVIVPALPTAGVVQLQPAGVGMDTNVVPVGITSVNVRVVAVAGPLLVTL